MIKTIAFFCIALFESLALNAQQLKIIMPGNKHILNDSVVSACKRADDGGFGLTFFIINASSVPLSVNVKREQLSILPGSENEMCWAEHCYKPLVNVTTFPETILQGDTAKGSYEFDGNYIPKGHAGTSVIRYVFFSSADSAAITVKYITTSISNQ